MTTRRPPRLALALLEHFIPGHAPLTGDLLEEFARRQSRVWFWWQVLATIWVLFVAEPAEIRPLRLVELQPSDAAERSRRLAVRFRPVNLTASPVNGVGGLGIVALCLLVTVVMPVAWLLIFGSMLAGVALGIVLISRRADRPSPVLHCL